MTFQRSYVSSSAATLAATAVSESGIELAATDGEGGGLADELMAHVNTLLAAILDCRRDGKEN